MTSNSQVLEGYSGKPLAVKLGMKVGMQAGALNAPEYYSNLFDIKFDESLRSSNYDFLHFFTSSKSDLTLFFPKLKEHLATDGMLWISWPKKSSKMKTDLDENVVRTIGLDCGLVDVKVCAVDNVWSGLKFVYRLIDR